MKHGDIVAIDDGPGGSTRFACILSWGSKTFDVVIESGGTERYWHSAAGGRNTRDVRPATLHDFGGDERYIHDHELRRVHAAHVRQEAGAGRARRASRSSGLFQGGCARPLRCDPQRTRKAVIGVAARYLGGCPLAGGERRRFERADVVAFGKLIRYNDFVTRYLVRLADGTEVFVKADEQDEADMKWLRKLGKQLSVTLPASTARDVGYAVGWKVVAP